MQIQYLLKTSLFLKFRQILCLIYKLFTFLFFNLIFLQKFTSFKFLLNDQHFHILSIVRSSDQFFFNLQILYIFITIQFFYLNSLFPKFGATTVNRQISFFKPDGFDVRKFAVNCNCQYKLVDKWVFRQT